MENKKVVITFEVDQNLNFGDLQQVVRRAAALARKEIDSSLGRIDNGRPSAAGLCTISYRNFDNINITEKNAGLYKITRNRKSSK